MESANTGDEYNQREQERRDGCSSVQGPFFFMPKKDSKTSAKPSSGTQGKAADAGKPAEPVRCGENALRTRKRRGEDTVRRERGR